MAAEPATSWAIAESKGLNLRAPFPAARIPTCLQEAYVPGARQPRGRSVPHFLEARGEPISGRCPRIRYGHTSGVGTVGVTKVGTAEVFAVKVPGCAVCPVVLTESAAVVEPAASSNFQ